MGYGAMGAYEMADSAGEVQAEAATMMGQVLQVEAEEAED